MRTCPRFSKCFHVGNFAITVLVLFLSACTGADTESPTATQPVNREWSVNMEVSGGFAGIRQGLTVSSTRRVTVEDHRTNRTTTFLGTDEQIAAIGQLVKTYVESDAISTAKQKPGKCADCFNYTLIAQSNGVTKTSNLDGFPEKDTIEWQLVRAMVPYLKELAPKGKK